MPFFEVSNPDFTVNLDQISVINDRGNKIEPAMADGRPITVSHPAECDELREWIKENKLPPKPVREANRRSAH